MGVRIDGASPQDFFSNLTATVVQAGEATLSQVAQRLGIPVEALQGANPHVQPDRLQAGQELVVPAAGSPGGQGVSLPTPEVSDAAPESPTSYSGKLDEMFDVLNIKAKLASQAGGAAPKNLDLDAPVDKSTIADRGSGDVPKIPLPETSRVWADSPAGKREADTDRIEKAPPNVTFVKKDPPPPRAAFPASAPKGSSSASGSKAKAVGSVDIGPPKPATVKDKVTDMVVDKIYKQVVGGLKSELTVEHHPHLSAEQEGLVDFSTGINQYKQYLDYAKTALDLLKLDPGNSEIKRRLAQVFGNLDQLGAHLQKVGDALGKAQKYANIVKDAIGITKSASNLVEKFGKIDFNNPQSVQDFADALTETNAQGQSVLQSARDSMISQGLKGGLEAAKGGLVLGALSFYLDMADQGLQAGLKNVKAYIDHEKRAIDQIEKGPPPPIPTLPPPPTVQTYAGQQLQDRLDKMGRINGAVENQFDAAKTKVKAEFDSKRREVHSEFDRDEFPKVYKQHRGQIEAALRAEIDDIQSGSQQNRTGGRPDLERLAALKEKLETMQRHDRSGPSMADLRSELKDLPTVPGGVHAVGPNPYVRTYDSSNPYKGTVMEKFYSEALAKTYKDKGLDEAGLQNAYAQAGLTKQAEHETEERLYREFKLTD